MAIELGEMKDSIEDLTWRLRPGLGWFPPCPAVAAACSGFTLKAASFGCVLARCLYLYDLYLY